MKGKILTLMRINQRRDLLSQIQKKNRNRKQIQHLINLKVYFKNCKNKHVLCQKFPLTIRLNKAIRMFRMIIKHKLKSVILKRIQKMFFMKRMLTNRISQIFRNLKSVIYKNLMSQIRKKKQISTIIIMKKDLRRIPLMFKKLMIMITV